MPASPARRCTASTKDSRSVSCRKLMTSPCLPDEKSWKKPLSSLTKKDGDFSLVKGDRPTYSRP